MFNWEGNKRKGLGIEYSALTSEKNDSEIGMRQSRSKHLETEGLMRI